MLDNPATAETRFWQSLHAVLADIAARAAARDHDSSFPDAEIQQLGAAGLLTATLPPSLGGLGLGQPGRSAGLARLFCLLGQASLPVARICEAHINALQLICIYGSPAQRRFAATQAQDGQLFALWVTDPPGETGVKWQEGRLEGGKAFCSAAGWAQQALITAHTPAGIQMLVVPTDAARPQPGRIALSGMRAAVTGAMDFSGTPAGPDVWLGAPGDYLREPVFSGGAWRGSAAALGGLTQLLQLMRTELRRRCRDGDPHQRARFGRLAMAREAARLWVEQAGERACGDTAAAEPVVAYVNLARLAVERLCLDAMQEAQRGLGLVAFLAGSPAERICRDLAAYLRQPAPDEVLDIAAAHYFANSLPEEDIW
jgi:alkylation response protein AidB-like acyl-CoA dehydrogenase